MIICTDTIVKVEGKSFENCTKSIATYSEFRLGTGAKRVTDGESKS